MHPLFKEMIYTNYWLWSHIMLGGILAKLLLYFFKNKEWRGQATVSCVLGIAIAFEVFEYFFLTPAGILDSVGDILGAVLMALIVVW